MSSKRGAFAGNHGQGSNWIRREKRLRIYARDGWRCCWCCASVLDGPTLKAAGAGLQLNARLASLDHFLARSSGGTNAASNLLTSCSTCNEDRGDASALAYASKLAASLAAAAQATRMRENEYRATIIERCLRSLDAPLLSLEERSAA